jgi:uncharacterized Zn-finger protein
MEIIKRGTKPEDREHTATCVYCSTQIKFLQGEATVRSGNLEIGCPVCDRLIVRSIEPVYRSHGGGYR